MNEELLNLEVRRFLKRFGITAQREMERAIRFAVETRAVSDRAVLPVIATLTIPGVLSDLKIEGEISLVAP